MAEAYIEYAFKVAPLQPGVDILIAQLAELDFESFSETEDGLDAYILEAKDSEDLLADIQILQNPEFDIFSTKSKILPVNWNSEWERHFEPIEVDGICTVRAPFHAKSNAKYDIVIEPKMSFGTGHHATTHLVIKHLLKAELKDKTVLDMGCGTGILAILASMRGAKHVDAIDNDRWCYENATENVERNTTSNVNVLHGDAALLGEKSYDVIIANINRNILLADIPKYASCLNDGGLLFLSGFYTEDIPALTEVCNPQGINFIMNFEKNNWVACKFVKN
ncbi:50S ribosomal protein L11 methyltransferase [Flavimarina sp. Hel_I_48]|uniref:50S ribosomal protein L11 methyltransferase n=1 Tax=Flavimarina sp. Hel_I_48 TaxID=1392488 RepID=UPI0004DF81A2|nr:50S ribosomal protein L11 methyltransferase [Flavimarina sp. Hel_I_48]